MNVRLSGDLQTRDGWPQLATAVSASLREADLAQWRVVLRPLVDGDAAAHANVPQRDVSDLGLRIWIDVADMSIEIAFPPGAAPTDGTGLGRLLEQMIDEAEDESDSDYDPPDDEED